MKTLIINVVNDSIYNTTDGLSFKQFQQLKKAAVTGDQQITIKLINNAKNCYTISISKTDLISTYLLCKDQFLAYKIEYDYLINRAIELIDDNNSISSNTIACLQKNYGLTI